MRNTKSLFVTLLFVASCISNIACDKEFFCEGKGTLTVSNASLYSIHQVIIDGAVYATLYPGEYMDIELAAGKYTISFVGLNGGGCYPSQVTLDACGSEWRSCDY